MKKVLFLIVLSSLLMVACTSKTEKLISEYNSIIGTKPVIENKNIYTWKGLPQDQFFKCSATLKDKTDKILNELPSEIHEKAYNAATGSLYSSYTWENPKLKVLLWFDYLENKEMIQLVITEK